MHLWPNSPNLPPPRFQDEEDGGISDRAEDMADVYHTFFGIAGLSLLGHPGLAAVDPTYALPADVVEGIQRRNADAAARRKGGGAAAGGGKEAEVVAAAGAGE